MKHLVGVVLGALTLGACASGAQPGAMIVPISRETVIAENAPLRSAISIGEVKGGKSTNPLWMSAVSNEAFLEALRQSLAVHTMLAGSDGKYRLSAELQRLDRPVVGFNMTVTSQVRYLLTNAATGATVFDRVISAPYTAKMGDAFAGVKRLQLANEGAVRGNIRALIEALIAESATNPALKADGATLISQIAAIAG